MEFSWKDIAGTVAPLAPKLGAVLGAGFGPVGSVIGGIAGNAIAEAFKVEPTPEAVGKAIVEDPNAAQKIQQLEQDRGQEILSAAQVRIEELKQETEQFRIGAEDTDKARQFQISLANIGSPLSWGATIMATVFTIAFFVLFAFVITTPLIENQIVMAFVGTLTAGMIQILAFFFGSSAGSRDKDVAFQHIAANAISKPNPSPAAIEAIKAAKKK